jgi:hypothetical protein
LLTVTHIDIVRIAFHVAHKAVHGAHRSELLMPLLADIELSELIVDEVSS